MQVIDDDVADVLPVSDDELETRAAISGDVTSPNPAANSAFV